MDIADQSSRTGGAVEFEPSICSVYRYDCGMLARLTKISDSDVNINIKVIFHYVFL